MSEVVGVKADREAIGRLIYEAVYADQGGRWAAVEPREVWYKKADWFISQLDGLSLADEQRQTLAGIVHDLREHSDAIHNGIKEHGSYQVPWSVLSWGKDMTANAAERIEGIIGDVCRQCGGRGVVSNPEARYEMDRDTGNYETNDPEEIDCPACDGTGLAPETPASAQTSDEVEIAF